MEKEIREVVHDQTSSDQEGQKGPDPLDDLFEERIPNRPREESLEIQKNRDPTSKDNEEEKDDKDSPAKKTLALNRKEALEEKEKSSEEEDQDSPLIENLKRELEKEKSKGLENHRYGRQNAQKLKNALRMVQEMAEEGGLDEQEAQRLSEALTAEGKFEDETDKTPYSIHPLGKFLKIADSELAHMKKYSNDDLLEDKISSFNHYIANAPTAEIEDLLEELDELSDEPLRLTKKLLQIGGEHYSSIYKELKDAGGISNYLKYFKQKEEKLNKEIDNLSKKLSQYEDYNKSKFRAESMSENSGVPSGDVLDQAFEERNRRYSPR